MSFPGKRSGSYPRNLTIGVKLVFGLKTIIFRTMTNSTVSFQGTVAWMAPELIRHEKCSQKVDIWSFGIILWELLTRQIPYNNWGQSQVMWEVGNNRISTPIPSNCPTQIGAILTSCIDFDAEKRPTFEDISKMIPVSSIN